MSNLSFARIMYGVSQEQPSHAALRHWDTLSQPFVVHGISRTVATVPATCGETLLQKAWHALTRHD